MVISQISPIAAQGPTGTIRVEVRASTTLLGGGHWQQTADVNDDAWADLPGYTRVVVRPRFLWDGKNGRTFLATAGYTYEDREGGTLDGSRTTRSRTRIERLI